MHFHILTIVAGIIVLILGANLFVGGASAVAKRFGVPPLLIGMVIVGFGTSMPELLVSATASFHGTPGIALGNAYGSNITNILLILGTASLINPIQVTRAVLARELPILLAVTALTLVLLWGGTISRLDAVVMLLVFAGCMILSIRQSRRRPDGMAVADATDDAGLSIAGARPVVAGLSLVAGLACLLISSEMLVRGATAVAERFGVSDLVIGLTVVAVGTSLPELASSIIAARKGEDDLALGNILGSNIFNSLMVVGVAGLIHPLEAEEALLRRDLPVMTAATILLYIFCRTGREGGRVTRMEGAVLVLLYAGYTVYLIHSAT